MNLPRLELDRPGVVGCPNHLEVDSGARFVSAEWFNRPLSGGSSGCLWARAVGANSLSGRPLLDGRLPKPVTGSSCRAVDGQDSVHSATPSGRWIEPADGFTAHDGVLHFEAHAYHTNPGDPPVDHVNFTVRPGNGGWRIACTVDGPPSPGDIAGCDWRIPLDLSGPVEVSFDIYDMFWNYTLAPDGQRHGRIPAG